MATELAVRNAGEVVPADRTATLDELAATVRREHEACLAAVQTTFDHAVRAGEALLQAREFLLPTGKWISWLEEHFPMHKSQAYAYMRVATYQHLIPEGTGIVAADRLVQGLSAIDGGPGRARVTDITKEEAHRLRESGASYKQIAKQLGASVSTVHYWFNDGTRSQRDRRARRALKKQEQERAVRRAINKTGGALAEAYSLAERMDDVLGQAHREATEAEARRELARAHEFHRAMRDSIVRGLGVE
jgi:predicted transcriptional regulator